MKRVRSTKIKHNKALLDGYAYHYFRSSEDGNIQAYRCNRYNKLRYEAKLRLTLCASSFLLGGVHIYAPDPVHCEAVNAIANIRVRTLRGSETLRKIYADNFNRISSTDTISSPRYESLQQYIQRAIKKYS